MTNMFCEWRPILFYFSQLCGLAGSLLRIIARAPNYSWRPIKEMAKPCVALLHARLQVPKQCDKALNSSLSLSHNMYIYTFTYTHGSKGLMWCNWHQTTLWTHEAKIMRKRWGRYWPDIKLLYVRGRQNHDDIGWKGEGFQDLIKGGKLISSSPEQGNWSFYSAQLVDKPLHT